MPHTVDSLPGEEEREQNRAGWEFLARLTAYASYLWMGILFLSFTTSLAFDLCRLDALHCGMAVPPEFSGPNPAIEMFRSFG